MIHPSHLPPSLSEKTVLGGVEPIAGHLDGSGAEPLVAGGAMHVPVQARVVHQDLQSAVHQQGDEQEAEGMRPADPEREAVRLRHALRQDRRVDRNGRAADGKPLYVGGCHSDCERRYQRKQRR